MATSRPPRPFFARTMAETQARPPLSKSAPPGLGTLRRRRTRREVRSSTATLLPASVTNARVPSGETASVRARPGSLKPPTRRMAAASITSSARPRAA